MAKTNYGMVDNFQYDKQLKAKNDTVVLRKLEKYEEREEDGIIISMTTDANARLTEASIESLGDRCSESGLSEGDVVLYDAWSIYKKTYPVCWTALENVIVKLDDEFECGFKAVGEHVVLQFTETIEEDEGIILTASAQKTSKWADVVACGTRNQDKVEVGEKVLYSSDKRNIVFTNKGTEYILVHPDAIMAYKK